MFSGHDSWFVAKKPILPTNTIQSMFNKIIYNLTRKDHKTHREILTQPSKNLLINLI